MKKKIFNIIIITCIVLATTFFTTVFLEFIKFGCFYRNLFHIYCAGCGGTRMIKELFKLNFYQAFRYNPLFFILTILFIIYFLYNIILYLEGKSLKKISFKTVIIIVIIMFIFMILRNIPGFEYLLPTKIK